MSAEHWRALLVGVGAALVTYLLASFALPTRTDGSFASVGAGGNEGAVPNASDGTDSLAQDARGDDRGATRSGDGSTETDAAARGSATAESSTEQRATAHAGPVLFGRVLVTGGEPAQATLRVTRGRDTIAERGVDARGRYAVGPLEAGAYAIAVDGDAVHAQTVEVEFAAFEERRRVDFELVPLQRLDVHVTTADGATLDEVLARFAAAHDQRPPPAILPAVFAHPPDPILDVLPGTRDIGAGAFMPRLPRDGERPPTWIGSLTIHERGAGVVALLADGEVLATRRVEPTDDAVSFVLDPARLDDLGVEVRATLVDAVTGLPVEGVVHLSPGAMPLDSTFAASDDRGSVVVANVRPGARWLVAVASGYADEARRVDVPTTGPFDAGVVALRRPALITGHVRTASGEGAVAYLRWGRVDPSGHWVEWLTTSTNSVSDGRFSLLVGRGTWAVATRSPYVSAGRRDQSFLVARPLVVDVTRHDARDVVLELERAHVVTCTFAVALDRAAELVARDDRGFEVGRASVAAGAFEGSVALPDGAFRIALVRAGRELAGVDVEVAAQPLEVALDR